MITTWATELLAWWHTLDGAFRFLLALPLAVAVAGLAATCRQGCRSGRARTP